MERVVDIADAAVKHMQHVVESSDMDEAGTVVNFNSIFIVSNCICRLSVFG